MKAFVSIVVPCILVQGLNAQALSPSCPKSYSVTFKIKVVPPNPAISPIHGELLLEENGGRLIQVLRLDKMPVRFFYFDGNESWYSANLDQVWISKGFGYSYAPVPLYMPTDFSSHPVYYSVTEGLKLVHKSKKDLSKKAQKDLDVFASLIFLNDNLTSPHLNGCTINPVRSEKGKDQIMNIGSIGSPSNTTRYSDFRQFQGVLMPGKVSIDTYDRLLTPESKDVVTHNGYKYELTLKPISPSPLNLDPVKLIPKGTYIQCMSAEPNFAFVYDPIDGAFFSQREHARKGRVQFNKEDHAKTKSSNAALIIPLVLSGVFGGSAIVSLYRSKKKKPLPSVAS